MGAGQGTPVVRAMQGKLVIGAATGIVRSTQRGFEQFPRVIDSLGRALETNSIPKAELRKLNRQIALAAQGEIEAKWRSRLPRGGGSGGTLSGKLGSALGDDEAMIAGTTDRVISFVNTEHLNRTAKHWYRTNYGGTGPNLTAPGSQPRQTFQVTVNNQVLLTLTDNQPPARGSWLPARFFWVGPQFVAARRPSSLRGAGTRAARFTDLGLETAANLIGPTYDTFYRAYIQQEVNRTRLTARGVRVPVDVRVDSYGYTVNVR